MKYLIIFLLLPLTAIAQSLLSGGCGNDIINPENNLQIALLKDLKKNNVFIKSINTSNNIEAEKYLSNNNEIKQYYHHHEVYVQLLGSHSFDLNLVYHCKNQIFLN